MACATILLDHVRATILQEQVSLMQITSGSLELHYQYPGKIRQQSTRLIANMTPDHLLQISEMLFGPRQKKLILVHKCTFVLFASTEELLSI